MLTAFVAVIVYHGCVRRDLGPTAVSYSQNAFGPPPTPLPEPAPGGPNWVGMTAE
jgi:hypothetical protein